MNLIIVEGIDRVGKTTLVNKLSSELNAITIKDEWLCFDRASEYVASEKLETMMSILKSLDESNYDMTIVLDRFHITEYVYGLIERGYANKRSLEIDKMLANFKNVILVYVRPADIYMSSVMHGKSLKKNEDLMSSLVELSEINKKVKCSWNTLDEAVKHIKEEIK